VVAVTSEPTTGPAGSRSEPPERPADQRIVVGVDGSPGARAAVVWALVAAARSGTPLDVVSVFPVASYWTDPLLVSPDRVEALRASAEARTRAFVAEATGDPAVTAEPGAAAVPVDFTVVPGAPAEELVQRASGARLLVVGSRGHGGIRSALLGSVALHCTTHAPCSVVVVHPAAEPARPRVVVGIDDSPVSRAALARAAEEAVRLGAEVEAVAVFQPVVYWSDVTIVPPPSGAELLEEARLRADAIVRGVLGDVSDPRVQVVAEVGAPGDVLVRHAEGASLLVVGSRSRSRLAGMVLGSVALHCAVHARCPVLVVRPEADRAATPERPAAVRAGR
jgi:nucleotide-binding universal stress UspA family protein